MGWNPARNQITDPGVENQRNDATRIILSGERIGYTNTYKKRREDRDDAEASNSLLLGNFGLFNHSNRILSKLR